MGPGRGQDCRGRGKRGWGGARRDEAGKERRGLDDPGLEQDSPGA